jgi:tryptophanase
MRAVAIAWGITELRRLKFVTNRVSQYRSLADGSLARATR